MRILVVCQYFWPEAFRVNDLVAALGERGHGVTVLTGMPNYPGGRYFPGYRPWAPRQETFAGAQVLRVPLVPRGAGGAVRLAANYLSFAALASARAAVTRRGPWDVSLVYQLSPVTQAFPALLLKKLHGVPVATWVQDIWPESVTATGMVRAPALVSAARRLSRWVYAGSDAVLAQSRAFLPRLVEAGASPVTLSYLPNWAEEFYAAPVGSTFPSEPWEDGFAVMFAGNLGRVQGLETLLEAASRVPVEEKVHWVFVGDGPLRGWMQEEVARRGQEGRVHFLGRRPVEEMPALFARAGAMIVSLAADPFMSLTIPTKLQSYLAAGRPVLGSLDGEGARVIAESGAGRVSPAGDADGLARDVVAMRRAPREERRELGRRGRAYYDAHFDRKACVDAMEEKLAGLAKRGSH
jgi:colanic acid biosynthesis glycosyl transferase WcaI